MDNIKLVLRKLGTKEEEFIKEIEIPLDDVLSIEISNGEQIFGINENRDFPKNGIHILGNHVLNITPSAANSIFLSIKR